MDSLDLVDLIVGLIVPIVAVVLAIMWKAFARAGGASAPDEWLAVFELLLAAMAMAISEVFAPVDIRNPSAAASLAEIALIAVGGNFVIATVTAFAINTAIQQHGYALGRRVILMTDGIGVAAFAGTFLALHL